MRHEKSRALSLKLVVIASLLGGCHAEDRVAPKDPVSTAAVQDFSLGAETQGDLNNQTFQNNKFFLWKNPLDPRVAEMVIRAGKQIDINEDEGVAARNQMTKLVADLGDANSAYDSALQNLDDSVKSVLTDYRDMTDEFVTTLTDDEIRENIAKTELDLLAASLRLDRVSGHLDHHTVELLASAYQLQVDRAKLSQTDPERDKMQKRIDDIGKQLPKLEGDVLSAKTAREALMVTYEGHFRDRARRAELETKLREARGTLPAVPADVAAVKARVDGLFGQKQDLFQKQYRIGKYGEALVNSVISNTTYFENKPERVTLNFKGKSVSVVIVGFPEKETTMSTENGSIINVKYNGKGGFLRFDAYPEKGKPLFYRFRIARNRLEINDGRVFYQGDMDLYENGRVLSHGVAKLATSN